MVYVHEKIREVRENNNLKQKEIAAMLNVSRTAYSLWEINQVTIPLENLNNLSNTFNIPLDYLVGLSNKKEKNINHNELNKVEIGKRLKQARKKSKLTQVEIADKLNTTHSVLSAYENGKVLIRTVFIIEWAKLTKTSIDWLCGKNDSENIV